MTIEINLNESSDQDIKDAIQKLVMLSNIPHAINDLDRLCVQTVSGEIEFMDEEQMDEHHLSQGGRL